MESPRVDTVSIFKLKVFGLSFFSRSEITRKPLFS